MPDRAINIGESEADADYQIWQDGEDLIIDHLADAAQFEYDASAGEWIVTDSAGNTTTLS